VLEVPVYPEPVMTYPKGTRTWARVVALTLAAVVGCGCAHAADLDLWPDLPAAPAYGYAGFFIQLSI
jgi:hypothetical protein